MMSHWRVFLLSVIFFSFLPALAEQTDVPESDPALEQRLEIPSVYKTRKGDTLKSISHFLYGHKSWWEKIKNENAPIRDFGADQVLPLGTSLRYLAPKIGAVYIVQPHDWLIRIVQWKYGATDFWEEVYKKNSKAISNPNLIHPGDRLILEIDGTVRQAGSGEVIVQGLHSLGTQTLPSQADLETAPHFLRGFLLGLLLLLIVPFLWWLFRRPSNHLKLLDLKEHSQKPKAKAKPVKKHEKKDRTKYPYTFERRRVEDLSFDRSLVHRDDGEIDRRPSYHTISKREKKKA
jgi:hypothetical protein